MHTHTQTHTYIYSTVIAFFAYERINAFCWFRFCSIPFVIVMSAINVNPDPKSIPCTEAFQRNDCIFTNHGNYSTERNLNVDDVERFIVQIILFWLKPIEILRIVWNSDAIWCTWAFVWPWEWNIFDKTIAVFFSIENHLSPRNSFIIQNR